MNRFCAGRYGADCRTERGISVGDGLITPRERSIRSSFSLWGITRSIRPPTRRNCWPASSSTRAAVRSCASAEPLVWRRRWSSSRARKADRSTPSHCSNSHRRRCATHCNIIRSDASKPDKGGGRIGTDKGLQPLYSIAYRVFFFSAALRR